MNDANPTNDEPVSTWNYAHAAVQRLDEHDDGLRTDGSGQVVDDPDEQPDVTIDVGTADVLLTVLDSVLNPELPYTCSQDTIEDAAKTLAGAVETAHVDALDAVEYETAAQTQQHGGVQFSVNLGWLRDESPMAAKHLLAASYALAGDELTKASRELRQAAKHVDMRTSIDTVTDALAAGVDIIGMTVVDSYENQGDVTELVRTSRGPVVTVELQTGMSIEYGPGGSGNAADLTIVEDGETDE